MELDSDMILRFVHDTSKPVRTMLIRLQLAEKMPEAVTNTPEAIRPWIEALDAVGQAFEDLRTLAFCSQVQEPTLIEWTPLMTDVRQAVEKNSGEWPPISINTPYKFHGLKDLLFRALVNIGKVGTRFGNQIESVEIHQSQQEAVVTTSVKMSILSALKTTTEDELARPFCPMSVTSLALTHNTGLMLTVAQAVAKMHGGYAEIKAREGKIRVDFIVRNVKL